MLLGGVTIHFKIEMINFYFVSAVSLIFSLHLLVQIASSIIGDSSCVAWPTYLIGFATWTTRIRSSCVLQWHPHPLLVQSTVLLASTRSRTDYLWTWTPQTCLRICTASTHSWDLTQSFLQQLYARSIPPVTWLLTNSNTSSQRVVLSSWLHHPGLTSTTLQEWSSPHPTGTRTARVR